MCVPVKVEQQSSQAPHFTICFDTKREITEHNLYYNNWIFAIRKSLLHLCPLRNKTLFRLSFIDSTPCNLRGMWCAGVGFFPALAHRSLIVLSIVGLGLHHHSLKIILWDTRLRAQANFRAGSSVSLLLFCSFFASVVLGFASDFSPLCNFLEESWENRINYEICVDIAPGNVT